MENRVNVQKQSEDREIRVTDLLWKILCSWRLILVCALVCAVLLAGLGSWKSRQGGIVEEMQPSLEELEEKLTEEENEGILKARELQGQIEAQKKYQAESIRMNLDPYAVNEVVFQYYVDTEYVINLDEEIQSDYGDELVWAYTAYVEKNVLQSLLKEKLNWDMDAAYIGELLHAEPANMGNQFTLTVVGVDADQAEELAEQAADVLETYQSTLTDKIGSHKLILLDRSTAVVHDTALADEQTKLDESISAWQTKLDTLTAAFSPGTASGI